MMAGRALSLWGGDLRRLTVEINPERTALTIRGLVDQDWRRALAELLVECATEGIPIENRIEVSP